MSTSGISSRKKQSAWGRIKKILLFISFSDPKLERHFLTRQVRDNLTFNRWVVFSGFLAYTGYFVMNYFLLPPGDALRYWGPYAAALIAVAAMFAVSFMDVPHFIFHICATASLLVATTAPLITITCYRYPESFYFHSASVLLLIASLVFIRISFYYTVLYAMLYLAVFEILYSLLGDHSAAETLNLYYILMVAIAVSLAINFFIEKRERTNFVKLRIIVEDRMRISKLRDARPPAGKKKA